MSDINQLEELRQVIANLASDEERLVAVNKKVKESERALNKMRKETRKLYKQLETATGEEVDALDDEIASRRAMQRELANNIKGYKTLQQRLQTTVKTTKRAGIEFRSMIRGLAGVVGAAVGAWKALDKFNQLELRPNSILDQIQSYTQRILGGWRNIISNIYTAAGGQPGGLSPQEQKELGYDKYLLEYRASQMSIEELETEIAKYQNTINENLDKRNRLIEDTKSGDAELVQMAKEELVHNAKNLELDKSALEIYKSQLEVLKQQSKVEDTSNGDEEERHRLKLAQMRIETTEQAIKLWEEEEKLRQAGNSQTSKADFDNYWATELAILVQRHGKEQEILDMKLKEKLLAQDEYDIELAQLKARQDAENRLFTIYKEQATLARQREKAQIFGLSINDDGTIENEDKILASFGNISNAIQDSTQVVMDNAKDGSNAQKAALVVQKTAAIGSVAASTGKAIAETWAAYSEIPFAGPAIAGTLTAALVANGLLQVSNIKNDKVGSNDINTGGSQTGASVGEMLANSQMISNLQQQVQTSTPVLVIQDVDAQQNFNNNTRLKATL